MAILMNDRLTLLDMAKRADPDGGVAQIAEVLNQTNQILFDMQWKEGNLVTGHRATIRTGIPQGTWRRINQGVQPSRSTTAQVDFGAANIENYSEMDVDLANLYGNSPAARFSEDKAIIEGIGQDIARTIFYGDERINPEQFTGMSYYYDDPNAESGENLINGDAGGTDEDYGSIWLIGWGDRKISGIVPKNSVAGMQVTDKGQQTKEGEDGRMHEVYRTHFKMKAGLTVEDWRYGVRIANIRRGELTADPTADGSNSANLPDLMFSAMERLPEDSSVVPVFYMDRTIREYLRKQMANRVANSTLDYADVGGHRTMMFQTYPTRRVDTLSATEAPIDFS